MLHVKTERRKIGDLGEEIAVKFLMKHGHEVRERNFLRKCGEIDIVSAKLGIVHFVEVKTIKRSNLSRETVGDVFRPEDNATRLKLSKVCRTAQLFLLENNVPHETKWQIDLITVKLDQVKRLGRVEYFPNCYT